MTIKYLAEEIYEMIEISHSEGQSREEIVETLSSIMSSVLVPKDPVRFAKWGNPDQQVEPPVETDQKTFKFEIPIGDWSEDGHGHCVSFIVESNKSVKEVREIYFDTVEREGDLFNENITTKYGGICSRYEDDELYDFQMEDLKLPVDTFNFKDGVYKPSKKEFCQLIMMWLMRHNPGLEMKIIEKENIPMLPFYGFDEKKRHISQFGYGLFMP